MKRFFIKVMAIIVIVIGTPMALYSNLKLALSFYWSWIRIEWASATVERFDAIHKEKQHNNGE